jgi:thioredoxin reductase (NADPH)
MGSTPTESAPLIGQADDDRLFPPLTSDQIERLSAVGHRRILAAGEAVLEPGMPTTSIFVVLRGALVIVRSSCDAEAVVARVETGRFTGEVSVLAGQPSMIFIRAAESSEVIEIGRERVLELVKNDSELSDLFMRVFLMRRVELLTLHIGDVVAIGSNRNADMLRVREFLERNNHPYREVDVDHDPDVQTLLDHFHVTLEDLPVLICRGRDVLRNPTNRKIADCLGLNAAIVTTDVRDLVIVGAGPSGLAAAVYGASEGLRVLVLETSAPGGQAGSSSKIENYLGFPTGISGQRLAARAIFQARKFGAEIMVARPAVELRCARRPFEIRIGEDASVMARAIVIATGAEYRKPNVTGATRFENVGLYYNATQMESRLCKDEEAIVVGGGNSAGQAAVYLASSGARHVHMLVRGDGLAETMSAYLIQRIEHHPRITLRVRTEIVAVEGDGHLEAVTWRDGNGETERRPIRHVFFMAGAVPHTKWLDGCIALDEKSFIKTGPDLLKEDLDAAHWPLARLPYLLETSLPGVFAAGDVRCGNMKRVASAVGEGSMAVAFVHRVLREM